MRVLLWHVHGSYTTSLVHGDHTWLLPVDARRGPDGRGRARTWDWPPSAVEVTRDQCAATDVDAVVLQRPAELDGLAEAWLGGRRPGRDVPAVYLEHNVPQGRINDLRHPAADRDDLRVVHVTHCNDLLWDCGSTPTTVIEHGVVDPGQCYTGELARTAVVINEPVRRRRVTGTDLLPRFAQAGPIDLYGMGATAVDVPGVATHDDVPQRRMHAELARRRVYVHSIRWTSLGLSLLEAMHLGMPVVAVGTTEAFEAVPPEAGVVSTDVGCLVAATRGLLADPALARAHGDKARAAALSRYGLRRFLSDWDRLLEEVTT
ncbi:MAG: glycosyltransferase [Actinobacteria bacterium]|nr:glycosyltransferase [Actinomycetota bacterium]